MTTKLNANQTSIPWSLLPISECSTGQASFATNGLRAFPNPTTGMVQIELERPAIQLFIAMKYGLLVLGTLLCMLNVLSAQKEDNIWLLGGATGSTDSVFKSCSLDFSENPFAVTHINKDLAYTFTNTSICDRNGNLICYSNGKNLYDASYKIMEGGANFYPNALYEQGVTYNQGYILLPHPKDSDKNIFVYGTPKVIIYNPPLGATLGYINLKYAVVEVDSASLFSRVVDRDLVVSTDTLLPTQITATRHGNGRDWWIVCPHYLDQVMYKFILNEQGVALHDKQAIASTHLGLGQACFSPDGQWYARFNVHGLTDSSYVTFDLYPFNRCTGQLGQPIQHTYNPDDPTQGKPGGVAFSPSSRFLYVSRWDSIFQYDLYASDIVASEEVVAVYDGFLGDFGRPTRFFNLLLAPDNRIYGNVANNNSRFMHAIENPDEAGVACSVKQHSIELPVFNMFLVPNIPYYRLYDADGSACDTLGINGPPLSTRPVVHSPDLRLYPNPAHAGWIILDSEQAPAQPQTLRFHDAQGRLALELRHPEAGRSHRFDIGRLPAGYYLLEITCANGSRYVEKMVVGR